MKVGIVGIGFVGDALAHSYQNKGIDLVLYDKFKEGGIGTLESVLETELCFLCLPTLYSIKENSYDLSAIQEVCQFLSENQYKGIVIVKSTIEPGRSEELALDHQLKIVHNPEFLTARTARHDFENQSHIVLGFTSLVEQESQDFVTNFYQRFYPEAEISFSASGESESMKIFVNSFYAVKVQMFNEFYLHCQNKGYDYNTVTSMMLKNGWINPMHTKVPGPDGKLSYGGACFPKDTQALLSAMKRTGTPHAVLEACVKERNQMRL